MFESETRVLIILPRELVDRARGVAGRATTSMKLPVSLQIVIRALIEEGLKRPTNPDLLANVGRQAETVRRIQPRRAGGRWRRSASHAGRAGSDREPVHEPRVGRAVRHHRADARSPSSRRRSTCTGRWRTGPLASAPDRRPGVPGHPVVDDRTVAAAMGARFIASTHLHRSSGRPSQPAPCSASGASSSSTSPTTCGRRETPTRWRRSLRISGRTGSIACCSRAGILGVGIGLSLLCLLIGLWAGLIAGGLHAILYVFVMAPLINAPGHWRGTKNFDNTAFNWRLLAWITGGESLHNNHHAHPRSAKFSLRRSEFDPSWPIIRSLAAAGLLVISGPPVA